MLTKVKSQHTLKPPKNGRNLNSDFLNTDKHQLFLHETLLNMSGGGRLHSYSAKFHARKVDVCQYSKSQNLNFGHFLVVLGCVVILLWSTCCISFDVHNTPTPKEKKKNLQK